MVFQRVRFTKLPCRQDTGALLPHLFILTHLAAGGFPFCGTVCDPPVPKWTPSR